MDALIWVVGLVVFCGLAAVLILLPTRQQESGVSNDPSLEPEDLPERPVPTVSSADEIWDALHGHQQSGLSNDPSLEPEARAKRLVSTPSSAGEIRNALRSLDWFQFEKLVTLYYQTQGFLVHRVGGAKADGGVDMILEHEGKRYVIQCKHWKKWTVGVRHMREFLGTLTDTGIPNGIYITTCGYTDEARDLASKHGIQLFEESQLVQCIIDLEKTQLGEVKRLLADPRKYCPRCESEMVLRVARKGSNAGSEFWGCSRYPRCKYILNADEKE